MSDNYIFNSPSIKTEETNTKVLNIWPGKGDEYSRVNILDLLYSIDKNLQYPFKLSDDNELVNATPAVGWFNASSLKDGVIKIMVFPLMRMLKKVIILAKSLLIYLIIQTVRQ
jgi:hypothetical protein